MRQVSLRHYSGTELPGLIEEVTGRPCPVKNDRLAKKARAASDREGADDGVANLEDARPPGSRITNRQPRY